MMRFGFTYNGQPYLADNSADLGAGVTVTAERHCYGDAEEWVLWWENTGSQNSGIFENLWDCDTVLPLETAPTLPVTFKPLPEDCVLTWVSGMVDFQDYMHDDELSATEFLHRHAAMKVGETRQLANIGGRSSDGTMPFFRVEAMGKGYVAAVGWTGDWKAELTREKDGMHVRTGLKHARFFLEPGEKIRTSSILIMPYEGDYVNKFRRLVREHFSHASRFGGRDGLCAFELWGGLTTDQMLERIRRIQNHDLPFAECWIDAGWYGQCEKCDDSFEGDWRYHTGDWTINHRVHPDDFTAVRDELAKKNMNIMLWFESERTTMIPPIVREHPDWLLYNPKDPDNAIVNYGHPQAWQYTFDYLADYIERLNITCFRQDFNVDLTGFFEHSDAPDRRGITEIKHITGMYALWEALLKKFPGLVIDNCSSGGRRIDIETVRRTIPFFRTDYQCAVNATAEVIQQDNIGIASLLPYQGCSTHIAGSRYDLRSIYTSSFGCSMYSTIHEDMTEEELRELEDGLREYQSIRRYFIEDFYNLGSSVWDLSAWTVWQYHDPKDDTGILMAFRRSESPFDNMPVALRGLAGKSYEMTNLDSGKTELSDGTLRVKLPEKRSSVIYTYRPVKE